MAVTQENKAEYVRLLMEWRLTKGIKPQMEALVGGLTELVPLYYLSKFDAQELEWVIAGTPEINLDDWKANTEYTGGTSHILGGEGRRREGKEGGGRGREGKREGGRGRERKRGGGKGREGEGREERGREGKRGGGKGREGEGREERGRRGMEGNGGGGDE